MRMSRWGRSQLTLDLISGMSQPVQCRCGGIYDLGKVVVVSRYTDCSMWQTPCCRQLADDRGPGWSAVQWYTRLDREGLDQD